MRTQSSFSGIETAAGTDNDTKTKEAGELEEKKEPKTVPFFKLFAFADAYDYLLMFVGSVGACIHGTSVPVFFIFFGKLINIIGLAYLFPKEASHKVAKYPHFFCQLLDLIQRLSREGSVNTGNNRSKAKSNARGQDQNPDLNSSLLISLLTSERREGGDLGLEREKHEEGKRESDLVQKKKKKKREEEEDIATHRNPTATHREPRLRATTATHDRDLSSFSAYPREVYAVSIVGPLDYSFMTPAKHEEESGSWREDAKLTTMAVSMVELTKMVQMVAELRCEKTGYLA